MTLRTMEYPGLLALVKQGAVSVHAHSAAMAASNAPHHGFIRPRGAAGGARAFIALPDREGVSGQGGEKFIGAALEAGAAYILCRHQALAAASSLPGAERAVFVEHPLPRKALGELAAAEYGTDSLGPRLIGITGTNGKTTSSFLLETLLASRGIATGVIGTVEYRWPGHRENAPLTTPGCIELHAMLRSMRQAGCEAAIMEVSSHALDQKRVAGLAFDAALFTNLTQDHLDYHGSMEAYYQAKARLFREPETGGYPLGAKALAINYDDPFGRRLCTECPITAHRIAFGFDNIPADRLPEYYLHGTILEQNKAGLRLRMHFEGRTWELSSGLVGAFNASNLLGAQALGLSLGLEPALLEALEGFQGVPGRMERVSGKSPFSVFVDYAHTPDALEKALLALKGAGFTRIVTVFGCGGDRDKTKRPLMAEAAARHSSVVVLTSDNPRTEDPLAIMADARPGLTACRDVIEEPERKKAIARALDALRPGDALLVAGKGHETYQIIGRERLPFSDRETVQEILGCN